MHALDAQRYACLDTLGEKLREGLRAAIVTARAPLSSWLQGRK
jgi:hypothetical protein